MALSLGDVLLSVGPPLLSGLLATQAAGKAAKATQTATAQGLAAQQNALAQARADTAPYRAGGQAAVNRLRQLLLQGVTPDELERFSPGYAFRLREGEKAINRAQLARGGYLSGRALKEALRYNQDYAGQEFGNYVNRLNALAGLGTGATNTIVNLSGSTGANLANLYGMQGANKAQAIIGGTGALGQGINTAGANLLAQLEAERLLGALG